MNSDGSDPVNLTCNGRWDISPDWSPIPAVSRVLIGACSTDGGSNPPFGPERPLAVVGQTVDGLVSATTLWAPQSRTVELTALENIGTGLAGAKITGTSLQRIDEDRGRGLPLRKWDIAGTPATGTVLIFFSGETGKVASIMAMASAASVANGGSVTTQSATGVMIEGQFCAVYSAADPTRNIAQGTATRVTLDRRTGEVTLVN